MEGRFIKYEIDRTVMFDFLDGHWYLNGVRPPTNQYRQLYLQYCMDEDFKEIQMSMIKTKKKTSSSDKSSKSSKPKKRKGKKVKRLIILKK